MHENVLPEDAVLVAEQPVQELFSLAGVEGSGVADVLVRDLVVLVQPAENHQELILGLDLFQCLFELLEFLQGRHRVSH